MTEGAYLDDPKLAVFGFFELGQPEDKVQHTEKSEVAMQQFCALGSSLPASTTNLILGGPAIASMFGVTEVPTIVALIPPGNITLQVRQPSRSTFLPFFHDGYVRSR